MGADYLSRDDDVNESDSLNELELNVVEPGCGEFLKSAPDKPLASVVIPTRNRVEELRNLLRSTLMQSVPVEIHVMDDGGSDATSEMIQREFPQAQYHRLGTGCGPAFQRNRGIELASHNIVFPIDDDSLFVSPHTVEQTIAEFDHPRIGAVGIPHINVRQNQIVRQRAPEPTKIYVTAAFVGAAHAIKRDVFLNLGGYREDFYIMGEEGDLCLRMLSQGYVTRLGCADPIHHLESPRRDFRRMDFHGRRNDILFTWHNVPTPYFPIHLLGYNFERVRFSDSRPSLSKDAGGHGVRLHCCFRWRTKRRPVAREVYRLHRSLKKCGPQLLSDIEPLLPLAQGHSDGFQSPKVVSS